MESLGRHFRRYFRNFTTDNIEISTGELGTDVGNTHTVRLGSVKRIILAGDRREQVHPFGSRIRPGGYPITSIHLDIVIGVSLFIYLKLIGYILRLT